MDEQQEQAQDDGPRSLTRKVVLGERIDWFLCDQADLSNVHNAILRAIEAAGHSLLGWAAALREAEAWAREKAADQIELERRRGFHRPPPVKKC